MTKTDFQEFVRCQLVDQESRDYDLKTESSLRKFDARVADLTKAVHDAEYALSDYCSAKLADHDDA